MEKAAYELHRQLSQTAEVRLVKWGGSNKWLPVVLPYILLKALWIAVFDSITVVYVQDGLLAPLGCFIKILRKPVVITIHGLDMTYDNRLYQSSIPRCVGRLDRVICVSNATRGECVKRGIAQEKIAVIQNGVSDSFYMGLSAEAGQELRRGLSVELGITLNKKCILLSVGRLVERKGIHWFVREVMPAIIAKRRDCIYLIVGRGAYHDTVHKDIHETGLEEHIFMLGHISDETLSRLYNVADVFVMPNISVKGDVEGFGLVTLEAASCELPVVASRLEGVEEAIEDQRSGFLVEPSDVRGFVSTINWLLEDDARAKEFGKKARSFVLANYGWGGIAQRYLEEFRSLQSQ